MAEKELPRENGKNSPVSKVINGEKKTGVPGGRKVIEKNVSSGSVCMIPKDKNIIFFPFTGKEYINPTVPPTLEFIGKVLKADGVFFYNAEGQGLTMYPAYYRSDDVKMDFLVRLTKDIKRCAIMDSFLKNKVILKKDLFADKNSSVRDVITRFNLHSAILYPANLISSDRRGVFVIYSFKKDKFTRKTVDFLRSILLSFYSMLEYPDKYHELRKASAFKDMFFSDVTHELKNPITTIKGFLSIILSGDVGPLTAQQKYFLEIAKKSTESLVELSENLLNISRLESTINILNMETVNVKQMADEVTVPLAILAEQVGIRIVNDIPADAVIYADPKWFQEVFKNLIENAIKYSGRDSRILLGYRKSKLKGYAVISVEDNGIGIPADEQKKLFTRFYRCPSTKKIPGTGLGLSIVKSIVRAHNGEVWFETPAGGGARFCAAVPREAHSPGKTK